MKETFLLPDISIEMVLEMFFLDLSKTNIRFDARSLIWRFFITTKALPTFKHVKQIDKHKFGKIALDKTSEIFVVQVAALKAP